MNIRVWYAKRSSKPVAWTVFAGEGRRYLFCQSLEAGWFRTGVTTVLHETKAQRGARKRLESLSLEREERLRNGRPTSSVKTAERLLYDQPVDSPARKVLKAP